ncbi:hypothetical protein V7111_13830 [Neobacillus niacini]|uniref:hypothetical protein n=1 Tax=Neobacillus niacini TaxID=86668 RepID=UPI003000055A
MFIKEAYHDSLLYEESALAHYIHHLLAEKKISLDDDISKLNFDQANHQKVAEMIRNNVLGFHKIRIYSLKMNKKDFIFIFAASEQEAIQCYTKAYHHAPLNCHESSLDFQFTRGNGVISFRDMRKDFDSFPAIAGYYNKPYSWLEA